MGFDLTICPVGSFQYETEYNSVNKIPDNHKKYINNRGWEFSLYVPNYKSGMAGYVDIQDILSTYSKYSNIEQRFEDENCKITEMLPTIQEHDEFIAALQWFRENMSCVVSYG